MSLDLFKPNSSAHTLGSPVPFSPLVLADRLITLAQEADRAGYHDSASRLVGLVYAVLDDATGPFQNDAW